MKYHYLLTLLVSLLLNASSVFSQLVPFSFSGTIENWNTKSKEHAVTVTENLKKGLCNVNEFSRLIEEDQRIPLSLKEINEILSDSTKFTALAPEQAEKFAMSVEKWTNRFPEAKGVLPEEIL